MKTQWPATVYRACILEECSAPYVLGIFLTAQGAFDKLVAERRKFNPNCRENVWLWVETVKDGIVIDKKHVPVVTESQRNEVYATA